jgi:hypothetical protein
MRTGGSNCNCESQSGGKCKRKLTAYNKFMKTEIQKVKKAEPNLTHQQAFKKAAGNWKGKK